MKDWTKVALVTAPVVVLALLVKWGPTPPTSLKPTPLTSTTLPAATNLDTTFKPEQEKPPLTAGQAPTARKVKPDSTSRESGVDAQGEIAAAIRSKGFNCASVWNVGDRGEDAFGKVYRVRCGPVSGVSTTPGDIPQFKVTIHSSGRARVQPWD